MKREVREGRAHSRDLKQKSNERRVMNQTLQMSTLLGRMM